MAVIHISEAEAAREFADLMARARAGEQIYIGANHGPELVLQRVDTEHVRLLSDSLRIAKERGFTATLDGAFAEDLAAVVDSHPESLNSPWD